MSFSASEIVTVANCTCESQYFSSPCIFLDLFAHAAQFFLHLKQIGHFTGLRFQHVDETLLHHVGVFQPRIGIEICLGHVFSAECLVL